MDVRWTSRGEAFQREEPFVINKDPTLCQTLFWVLLAQLWRKRSLGTLEVMDAACWEVDQKSKNSPSREVLGVLLRHDGCRASWILPEN